MFKRKAYEELLKWKREWDGKYAWDYGTTFTQGISASYW